MKITGPTLTGPAATTGRTSTTAAGFAPSSPDGSRETAAAGATAGVSPLASLDALLTLQEAYGPLERKKRAMRRAGGLLDALDQVKLAMLDPSADPAHALGRLQAVSRDLRDGTEDPGLESVLDEIDTRAAVELAKAEVAARAQMIAN